MLLAAIKQAGFVPDTRKVPSVSEILHDFGTPVSAQGDPNTYGILTRTGSASPSDAEALWAHFTSVPAYTVDAKENLPSPMARARVVNGFALQQPRRGFEIN